MSVLDLDIPFALAFALSGLIDVITTILVMATVTWQVLLVAIPIILAARYFQVKSHFNIFFLVSSIFQIYKICETYTIRSSII